MLSQQPQYALSPYRRLRPVYLVLGALALLVPFGLELAGVLPPSYAFEHGRMIVLPKVISLSPTLTPLVLAISVVVLNVLPAIAVGHMRDRNEELEARWAFDAWQLEEWMTAEGERV